MRFYRREWAAPGAGRKVRRRLPWAALTALALLAGCGGGGGSPAPAPAPPTITSQPQSLTVNAGQSASFRVVASGADTFQWLRNGQAIAGATAATYTLSPASSANNGDTYLVMVGNAGGSVNSASAMLRVTGVSVIAGQPGGMGYQDGPAAQARFWGPIALAFDQTGNLLVADYNAIRKIDPSGNVSTLVGSPRVCADVSGAASIARLCYPYSLTTDAAGHIYAGDNLGTLWQIDSSGNATQEANAFTCPFGLAQVATDLFIADACASTITRFDGVTFSAYATPGGTPLGLSSFGSELFVANDTYVQAVSPGAPPAVSLIAGKQGVPGSADGYLDAARFGCQTYPYALTVGTGAPFNGAFGVVAAGPALQYVGDFCNNTIRQISASTVTTLAGTAGRAGAADGVGAAASFWGPAGMTLDAAGNLYVADYGNALIRKITPAGDVSTFAGQAPHFGSADGTGVAASFRYPLGIAGDAGGNLYVADGNHTIRRIVPGGVVSTLAGTPGIPGSRDSNAGVPQFFLPRGMAADAAGNLFVADSGNYTVRRVTVSGVVSTVAGRAGTSGLGDGQGSGATFKAPGAIAIDSNGILYVSDGAASDGPIVRTITPAGVVATIHPMAPPGTGAIRGLTVTPAGTLIYLTTRTAVYSLTPAGVLTLLAGGAATGAADGTGNAASFNAPRGIVLAGDGNLYVADQQNSTIRRVTPAGVVTTPVGTPVMPMGIAAGGLPARLGSPWGIALLGSGKPVSLAVTDQWESVILRVDLP
ncbi:MAG: hypothetical protein JOZ03_08200 [Gammaproteobacteria bacterium]|nr:hypothetical protein [Gammaproteobacteria bacterium]